MKLNASMLVVVASLVASVGAMGCKSQDKVTDNGNDVAAGENAVTPEDNPAAAPVSADGETESSPGFEKDYWRGNRYWAYRAPPAARYERVGVARPGYFWRPGYHGWNGRDYTWYDGGYYPERPGYRYANPAWYPVGNRWGYRPGRWYRR